MVGEAGDLKCLKGSTSGPVPVSRPGFFLFVTHILPPTSGPAPSHGLLRILFREVGFPPMNFFRPSLRRSKR
jgi:hypothetical protein